MFCVPTMSRVTESINTETTTYQTEQCTPDATAKSNHIRRKIREHLLRWKLYWSQVLRSSNGKYKIHRNDRSVRAIGLGSCIMYGPLAAYQVLVSRR